MFFCDIIVKTGDIMDEQERRDLLQYFHLKEFYNNGEILEDEYQELQEIIKRSKRAQEIEAAEIQFYSKKISGEEYHQIVKKHEKALFEEKTPQKIKKPERRENHVYSTNPINQKK